MCHPVVCVHHCSWSMLRACDAVGVSCAAAYSALVEPWATLGRALELPAQPSSRTHTSALCPTWPWLRPDHCCGQWIAGVKKQTLRCNPRSVHHTLRFHARAGHLQAVGIEDSDARSSMYLAKNRVWFPSGSAHVEYGGFRRSTGRHPSAPNLFRRPLVLPCKGNSTDTPQRCVS